MDALHVQPCEELAKMLLTLALKVTSQSTDDARMSKFTTPHPKESTNDDTGAAMTTTLNYCSNRNQLALVRVGEIVSNISSKSQQRLYLRWLLSRDQRICVVDVCKTLLRMERTVNLVVKDEIESELIVHVAVDLLQELLKAGLELDEFLNCPSMTSYRNDNSVEALWDCMIFRSLLYGKSGLRYERRQDTSERYAYVIIVAMIQACSHESNSLEALANMIYKYPIHPVDIYTYGKVFRALVVAGIGPSESFVSEMKGMESKSMPGYYEPYREWYSEYRRQVPSLKHCARLVIRRFASVNMELAVSRLEVPTSVSEFILLKDSQTLKVINIDDVD